MKDKQWTEMLPPFDENGQPQIRLTEIKSHRYGIIERRISDFFSGCVLIEEELEEDFWPDGGTADALP
jgi:hypothetical protein